MAILWNVPGTVLVSACVMDVCSLARQRYMHRAMTCVCVMTRSRSGASAIIDIGYIPHEHIIGISKLTRLVRLFAKRFTVQERLGEQIVNTFDTMLQPHGVALYLEAHHLCTEMRGVRETSPLTHTTFWRGEYERNSSLRVEFLLACEADL